MPALIDGDGIVTKDGKAYCSTCEEFLPSDSTKGVKQHLKSKTHKACLQGGKVDKKKKVSHCISHLVLKIHSCNAKPTVGDMLN